MSEEDENRELEDWVREVRDALEEADVDSALETLMEAREAGFFQPALDEAVEVLRDDPDEEAIQTVDARLAAAIGDESPNSTRFAPDVADTLAGEASGDLEADEEGPGEDSTARDAASSDEGSSSNFKRDSSQVTAVGHESLSDLAEEELDGGDREIEGASSEFERLPSAESELEDDAGEEDWIEVDDPEEGRATERNPAVDEIASDEMKRSGGADAGAESGDGPFGAQGDVASSFLVEDEEDSEPGEASDEDAEGSPEESTGPAMAGDSEREFREGADSARSRDAPSREEQPTPMHGGHEAPDVDLGLDNPGEGDDAGIELTDQSDEPEHPKATDESEARHRSETPAKQPAVGFGEASEALAGESSAAGLAEVSSSSSPSNDVGADSAPDEALEDEAFFELAEELSEADEAGAEGSDSDGIGGDDPRATSQVDAADPRDFERAGGSSGVERLLDQARELMEEGTFDSAEDLVRSVLDQDPENQEAQQLLVRIEQERARDDAEDEREATAERQAVDPSESVPPSEREAVDPSESVPPGREGSAASDGDEAASDLGGGGDEQSVVDSLEKTPTQEIEFDEISEEEVDHRMGFLLSLVDGETSFEDILDLSSMPRHETLSVLDDMLEKEIISVD